MKQKLLILILAFSPWIGLFAQTGTITGRVTDSQSDKAIPTVTVKVATQQTVTDAEGKFKLDGINFGDVMVEFSVDGYLLLIRQVELTGDLELGAIQMSPTLGSGAQSGGLSEVNIGSLDSDDESNVQDVGGLLSSSDDVFSSIASYTFGPLYFRTRGYDNDYNLTYIGNTAISDVETGRTTWAIWGGLNDATRNKVSESGLAPSSFSFGSIGGNTNIILRASQHRAQTKLTYSLSNKTNTNRLMITHSTGKLDNGWALTFSGSRRWGQEGYVEGTNYDAWSYFVGIEKELNLKHSISLSAFAAPVRRGMQGGSVQEAYDITGSNYYNPNWGYQNGEKRNARERIMNQPVVIFNHYWKVNEKTLITNAVTYMFGETGTTALNWYNAADPRPDYYRYLPSYFPSSSDNDQLTLYNPELEEDMRQAWQSDDATAQINWDHLYQQNFLANMGGEQARYIVENRHTDQKQLSFTSNVVHELNSNTKINGGFEYASNTGSYYKTIEDIMGGNYWVDKDQFAERDFPGNDSTIQNDLNNPNRIVKEGDKYGYDYQLHQNTANLWATANFTSQKLDYYAGLQLTYTSFWREGFMRNGRFPETSYGNGEKHNFVDYSVKAGATYKITGRHFIEFNAAFLTLAPNLRNSYLSSRIRDAVVPYISSEEIAGGELSYHLRAPMVKARLTVYHTIFNNQSEVTSFYHDNLRTFVNYATYGISRVHQGIEAGAEIKLNSIFAVVAAANLGNYRYTNRPTAIIAVENGSKPDTKNLIYQKSFFVPGSPQTAYSLGLKYSGPSYLFVDVSFNYFDNNYLDFNPERRTSIGIDYIYDMDSPLIDAITKQVKLPSAVTMDASIGKSFRINDKYYLNLNLSVNNLLDNKEIVTGGYEQSRFLSTNLSQFEPKRYYYFGRTYFLNIGFRF